MKTIQGSLASGQTAPSPTITCYPATTTPNGVGIIIFPGGGYGGLADHEGKGYADALVKAGISCFVVRYRLGPDGHRHPAMLEDALAAVATIRSKADAFGIDPTRLGVMGSSAGGHLAAHALTAWHTYESPVSLRPDFGILCYPVILSQGSFINKGSIHNLAGGDASAELLAGLSCDRHVSKRTPPCFLWHTVEDQAVPVENSMAFATALRAHGVPFEMHIYPFGRHGLGLGASFDWLRPCLRWIDETSGSQQS
jgi:acetyl esterase/lipase